MRPLSATQRRWLELLARRGRIQVGSYKQMPERTAQGLAARGLIRLEWQRLFLRQGGGSATWARGYFAVLADVPSKPEWLERPPPKSPEE